MILDQQTQIEAARHQKWKDDILKVEISMKLGETEKELKKVKGKLEVIAALHETDK